ncbi:ABC transporter substrate-binding protein [Rubrobacter taiwanensis]|uniref:ABC transporter substrate-binding protein n=1 Tax=Rubrobacter taiwanensis TaxID=185139 RepID=UPI0024366F00|nr:ABC transporter substrate-binding protein [Rubrobacter taiwanensis]
MSDYEERVVRLREDLPQSPEETGVAVLQVSSEYVANYSGADSFAGAIVDEIGFAPAQNIPDYEISLELIPDIDADHIFVHAAVSEEEDADEVLDTLLSEPLWQRNPAVREDRAYVVGEHWYGFGLVAANAVLDDLEKYLFEERS